MAILILGLVLFLGVHSARIVADGARSRFIAARGELTLATVALGCAAWALFALWVHGAWLGIRPLG